ncbi:MAG: esterase-like activity of phytase family protein [Cyanobacteria bacterium LVE1205-1]
MNPFLCEFNLESGQQQSCLPLPHRYLIQPQEQSSSALPPQGVQNNLAFESLAIHREGMGNPFVFLQPPSQGYCKILMGMLPNKGQEVASFII